MHRSIDTSSSAPISARLPAIGADRGSAARIGRKVAFLVCLVALSIAALGARSTIAQTTSVPGSARGSQARPPASPAETDPTVSRSVAARSRMLECGHQWSAMKKAGTAVGTWREFSRSCLAQR